MQVIRNVMVDPYLVPGGGAFEMALARMITEKANSVAGVQQWPYRAVGKALEVIPRTLIQNCGANTIRVLTALRVRYSCLLPIDCQPSLPARQSMHRLTVPVWMAREV